ncbi:MAG: helix-turn-helix domain-containing protein [bacterium]|nr:helix-turn-helix domain-containing protein [bacterium]
MLHELKKIGLSDKEAKVYVALLELGKASVQDIAKKAGVNRATTYLMIEALQGRGLAYKAQVGKRTHFAVNSPEKLTHVLDEKRKKLEDEAEEIKELLPELKALYAGSPEKPKMRFYEGKEGIKEILNDVFESGAKEIREIYAADYIRSVLSAEETKEVLRRRTSLGMRWRALYTRKEGPYSEPIPLGEDRFVSADKFPIMSDIVMYGDRVAFHTLQGKQIGIIIENPALAKTFETIFELAWRGAEEI